MNVVSAAKPWATGMSPASLGRGRRAAGNGSASSPAIISSVTMPAGGTPPPDPPAAGGEPSPDPPGGPSGDPPGGTATGYGVHRVTVLMPRAMAPVISVTPSQPSGPQPVLMNPSQITSPLRAMLACPNTTAGGTPSPVARCRRSPPRVTQVRSM